MSAPSAHALPGEPPEPPLPTASAGSGAKRWVRPALALLGVGTSVLGDPSDFLRVGLPLMALGCGVITLTGPWVLRFFGLP